MPAGDKTGPQGLGSLTGRGLGICGQGMRMGMGRGGGLRCRRGLAKYYGLNAYKNKEEQVKDFESYRLALKEELEDIDQALTSLKKSE